MSFADTVKQTVESIEREPKSTSAQAFRAVLEELAHGLAQTGVGAEIRSGRDPRQMSLYLYPSHRPNAGSHMLMFRLRDGAIIVSGQDPTSLATPTELETWLIEFIKLPAFAESLSILRERATEPVEARLCEYGADRISRGDVLVWVQSVDQARIATLEGATPDGEVTVEVERVEFPGNAPLRDAVGNYAALDSAGVLLRVTRAKVSGNRATITGMRIAR